MRSRAMRSRSVRRPLSAAAWVAIASEERAAMSAMRDIAGYDKQRVAMLFSSGDAPNELRGGEMERRTFLKAGAAGAFAVTSSAKAAGNGARPEAPAMARGMTLLTMRDANGYTPGVKTAQGVLDGNETSRAPETKTTSTTDGLLP